MVAPLPVLSPRYNTATSYIAASSAAPGPAAAVPWAQWRPANVASPLRKHSPWAGCMLQLVLLTCIILASLAAFAGRAASMAGRWSPTGRRGAPATILHSGWASVAAEEEAHTLVLYVWSNSNEYYLGNLQFFVKHGMPGCDGCRYVVIVNEDDAHPLPANARYVRHENRCFDWGTFGWALQSGVVSTEGYKFFIFLNSSVRGPFLPPYLRGHTHFTEIMTRHISADVKLVGPNINCGGMALPGSGQTASNPHVQSFAVATDAVGLDTITRNGSVLACYSQIRKTVFHSELGLSAVLLDAGFNIGCFMSKYEGVDWRDRANWGCNGGRNPLRAGVVDGVPLSVYELLFVKVKTQLIKQENHLALAAVAYDGLLNRSSADEV